MIKEKKEKSSKEAQEKTKKTVSSEKSKLTRRLKGVVVAAKMQKTVVVAVNKFVEHAKYKKRYKVTKRYKAHDEKQEYKKDDQVIIEECRPFSKEKSWRVISKK